MSYLVNALEGQATGVQSNRRHHIQKYEKEDPDFVSKLTKGGLRVKKLEQSPIIYEQYNDIISQQAAQGIEQTTELEATGDLVTGCENTQEAVSLYERAKDRMKEGGFHLRKWKSNDRELAWEIAIKEGEGVKERLTLELE
eukprot:gene19-biopygen508